MGTAGLVKKKKKKRSKRRVAKHDGKAGDTDGEGIGN